MSICLVNVNVLYSFLPSTIMLNGSNINAILNEASNSPLD